MTEQVSHIFTAAIPYADTYRTQRGPWSYAITQKDEGYKVHPLCWTLLGGNFFFDMRQKPGHDTKPLETITRELKEEFGVIEEDSKETLATILGGSSEKIAKSDANFKPNAIPYWAEGFMGLFGEEILKSIQPWQDFLVRVSKDYLAVTGKPAINYIASVFAANVGPDVYNCFADMSSLAKMKGKKLITEGNGLFPLTFREMGEADFGWGQDRIVNHLFDLGRQKFNETVSVEPLGHTPLGSYDEYLKKYNGIFTFRGA